MRLAITTVRRVSLEVIIFCVLLYPMEKCTFFGVVGLISVDVLKLVLKDDVSDAAVIFMSTYPWSYTKYLTEQLMMTYPVSVKWNISFFVNNRLEYLYWKI